VAEVSLKNALSGLLPEEEASRLASEVARLPEPPSAIRTMEALRPIVGRSLEPARLLSVLTLAGFSPYLGSLLVQNPEFIEAIPPGGLPREPRTREDLEEDLARFIHLRSRQSPSLALRQFAKREILRIALADAEGAADLATVTRALSLRADVLLGKALVLARAPLEARHGRPTFRDDRGHLEEATFTILALGKLGGEELNYSSDVDLMYLFSRDGETSGVDATGRGSIGNKEFFTRLSTDVTRLIAGSGPEGHVFRVDLDLRPGGKDGEITLPVAAAVAYYGTWAEGWERQALIKARPAAGDMALGRRFIALVEALVYRPQPDPNLIVDMVRMKDDIDARLSSEGRSDRDIKLGRGGIRELEFGAQALQLLHGGRDPWLRQSNTLLTLHRLADKGLVEYGEYAPLTKAYIFLRDLEHRLQLGQNRRTSTLPVSSTELRLVARRMRMHEIAPGREPEALLQELDRHREVVRRFYDSVVGTAAQPRLAGGGLDIWLDRLDDETLRESLKRSGLGETAGTMRPVKLIRKTLQSAATAPPVRRALHITGPTLLAAIAQAQSPRRALDNLEKLFSALVADEDNRLPEFLSRPALVGPTVRLLGRSDLFAGLLIRRPALLLSMEDRGRILKTPGADDYLEMLAPAVAAQGESSSGAELRRRHQEALALIALRDINRQATLREVLKSLSDLADATLRAAVRLARRRLAEEGRPIPAGLKLAVIGLGRLGYREMDYSSDLDLVFVGRTSGRSGGAQALARLWCERVVEMLSSVSRDGQLYRVDLRLRPSGREGELVATESGLEAYFRDAAEVWEMQSFLKARPAAGDPGLGKRCVDAIQSLILEKGTRLGAETLRQAVDDMRRRLVQEARREGRGSVKLGEGGLFDIHFVVEYLQLRHGVANPPDKDTLRLLTTLNRLGHLTGPQLTVLYESYLFFRTLDHEMRLVHDRPLRGLPDDPARLSEIGLAFEGTPRDPAERAGNVRDQFERHAAAVRAVYADIVG